jgi:CHAT domain-containing protein
MKRLILKLSLSEQDDIVAEVIESPAGTALKQSNTPAAEKPPGMNAGIIESPAETALKQGNIPAAEKPPGMNYQDLESHKGTLLKALEVGVFQDVFSDEELSWLVKVNLLDSEKTHFLSLLKNVGQMLYQAMFHSNKEAEAKLHESRVICGNTQRLHVQLMVNEGDERSVRLFDYPWELLYEGKYFLTQRNIVFSRYIAYGEPLPELHRAEKLRVLLVSLNASDPSMELPEIPAKEFDEIYNRLNSEQAIQVKPLTPSSFSEFGNYLARLRPHEIPHVIHFHGHGLFGKHCTDCRRICAVVGQKSCVQCGGRNFTIPQGYLLFRDDEKPFYYASAKRLSDELGTANLREGGKRKDHIALVVLSACQSGLAKSNPSIFNGMSQSLINVGIPAVVGMQFTVEVDAAADFAARFYSSLGRNAFLFEALAEGRVAMNFEGHQWYRPVIYTRWQGNENGELFKPTSGPTPIANGNRPPNFWPSSGNFYERANALYIQIQEKNYLVSNAHVVFNSDAIWSDNSKRELEHLQEFCGFVKELSSYIDRADIGKLTEKENELRNDLKKSAHDCTKALDELIAQVAGLTSFLKNHSGSKPQDFDTSKSGYLNTIRNKFITLDNNLDQLHKISVNYGLSKQ